MSYRSNSPNKGGLSEDELQKDFLYKETHTISDESIYSNQERQRLYEKDLIKKINEYLARSMNTHTIAVSANIKTVDQLLIIGKRSASAIDAGEYYCSVNGQSEFQDANVSFYKTSVFEDLPSMNYQSECRIDLTNEIQREAIAELGITLFNNEWKYYGVSFLSIHNPSSSITNGSLKENVIQNRRMHFNVLTYNSTPYTFKEIVRNQKLATEHFENIKIRGIRTNLYNNLKDQLINCIKKCWDWFRNNKSNIFLLYLFISYILAKRSIIELELKSIVDLFVFFVYLVTGLMQLLQIYG